VAELKPTRDRTQRREPQVPWPQATLAIFVVATAAGGLALVSLTPRLLVLPVLSLAAIASAAVVAVLAWLHGADRHSSNITSWDVAGALAFIGCAAGMLTGSDQILQAFGYATMPR
jgi:hypothetical protein